LGKEPAPGPFCVADIAQTAGGSLDACLQDLAGFCGAAGHEEREAIDIRHQVRMRQGFRRSIHAWKPYLPQFPRSSAKISSYRAVDYQAFVSKLVCPGFDSL
jgi:hypothetical protein